MFQRVTLFSRSRCCRRRHRPLHFSIAHRCNSTSMSVAKYFHNMLWIYSTYRDVDTPSQSIKPYGLEWGLPGTSHMFYYQPETATTIDRHEAIVHVTNQWRFAKDLSLVTKDDIIKIEQVVSPFSKQSNRSIGGTWWSVDWNQDNLTSFNQSYEDVKRHVDIPQELQTILTKHPEKALPVWIGGRYIDDLTTDNWPNILQALQLYTDTTDSQSSSSSRFGATKFALKLGYRKRHNETELSYLGIARYFSGGLRSRSQVIHHLLDNLYTLEDVTIVEEDTHLIMPSTSSSSSSDDSQSDSDENDFAYTALSTMLSSTTATPTSRNPLSDAAPTRSDGPAKEQPLRTITMLGTTTLPDWIMGGQLTSRLWVKLYYTTTHEDDDTTDIPCRLEFRRPLYHDDVSTSDRYFDWARPTDSDQNATTERMLYQRACDELQRLLALAQLVHPLEWDKNKKTSPQTTRMEMDGSTTSTDPDVTIMLPDEHELRRERNHRRNRKKKFGL